VRDGVWRTANGFIITRDGAKLSLIATSWPFSPVRLAVYSRMGYLTSYLGRAIGLKETQAVIAEPKREAVRRRRGSPSRRT
jgi:hypothetical protein